MLGSYPWALRLHNFFIDEGCSLAPNADEIEGNGSGFVPSDINETIFLVNSVLHDIKVKSCLSGHWKRNHLITLQKENLL